VSSSRSTVPAGPSERRLPAAVLFDLDGTLVDTEPYWIDAEYRLVDEHGGRWTDDDAHALIGNDLIVSADYLREVGGVDLDPPGIVDRLLDLVVEATRREVPWRPGARELLAECRAAGVPTALVTMSYARFAGVVVDQLPPQSFAAVVTGDQVRRGKPHPEAYVEACRRLDVDPRRSVALEDSNTGIAAAEAAGCVVVGIPNRVEVPPAAGRTLVESLAGVTLAELAALLPD
jgi:HAD superfamily hydrolase (TIGR01509 family)